MRATVQDNPALRQTLLRRLAEARQRSDALFELVRPEALYDRPILERHRFIFYIGHVEAFDWNLLHQALLGGKSFHPDFDRLFAFGIDPVGGGLPADQPSDWPSLKVVREYAQRCRSTLDAKFAAGALASRAATSGTSAALRAETLLNVAIEHRLMHLETLAYMLHRLPFEKKLRQAGGAVALAPPVVHRMVGVPAGTVTLGLERSDEQFGWDNEYEALVAPLPAFEIDRYMVTHRQYLDFVTAGGYEMRECWSVDDWAWKSARGLAHPLFWETEDGRWWFRGMFEKIPLPLDWPVYVSHAEAAAYARWAGKSLPTEAEWHRAAYGAPDGGERSYPWGSAAPHSDFGNFDFARWDPMPVHAHAAGRSAFGLHGMLGNGWEWTSTEFAPFPGFQRFSFYPGYSADFFDGEHYVMKGGSSRTAGCLLRRSFRNWFQAHYPYVYAGFRCVRR